MRTKVLLFSLFLVLLVPVYADSFVTMTLTGLGPNGLSVFDPSNEWGGEPVSPYQAQVGNNTFLVFCLDMQLSTNVGQGYSYDVTTNARPNGDTTPLADYEAAAYLAKEILGTSDLTTRGELSFAIWDIFEPDAVEMDTNSDVSNNLRTIEAYEAAAMTAAGNNPQFALYYPGSNSPVDPPPGSQRFIQLVPDGGMTLMLLGGALIGLETLRRKLRV
jgi:hypothetical protein